MELIVCSWNLLAHSTVNESKVDLAWSVRLPQILKLLQNSNAGLLLLQEVELSTFEQDFAPLLNDYKYERHKIVMKGKHSRTNSFGNVTMWKVGTLQRSSLTSRCVHVALMFESGTLVMISNVHFPAKNGLEGYLEKRTHLNSCVKTWGNQENIIFAGDLNDGLDFRNAQGGGLGEDVKALGFVLTVQELGKRTCKSSRTGLCYNVDHVLCRGQELKLTFIDHALDVSTIPNAIIPSDHLPIFYKLELIAPTIELARGTEIAQSYPVDPNPPEPRCVAESSCTS